MAQPTNCTAGHDVPSRIKLSTKASSISTRSQKPSWTQRHFVGWRSGILNSAILASLVFCINLAATLYATVNSIDKHDGRLVIWKGDCERTRHINTGLHLVINVLSTLLLSASSYGMQCLSAPTRSEIDMAHSTRKWLDIGVLSFRNLKSISGKRVLLYALLATSSIPLHLL
jgi:uncharacterized protein DUF6536